ncbi:uncharacterized protein DSM5745_09914 [Aspergillus mulundensis]|uniref:Uncharacterized protein n=1 Tax=Aspergillus mulundensis TaxID=1810919 RepID=A0A3D8QRQ3_9EURO|nr:hypothetical protein DSM5745_09914 [Aspergillus mulundensis]RDW64503.1 hypothetical protein DSM5745_09914 [Aspergillus mulundensis]
MVNPHAPPLQRSGAPLNIPSLRSLWRSIVSNSPTAAIDKSAAYAMLDTQSNDDLLLIMDRHTELIPLLWEYGLASTGRWQLGVSILSRPLDMEAWHTGRARRQGRSRETVAAALSGMYARSTGDSVREKSRVQKLRKLRVEELTLRRSRLAALRMALSDMQTNVGNNPTLPVPPPETWAYAQTLPAKIQRLSADIQSQITLVNNRIADDEPPFVPALPPPSQIPGGTNPIPHACILQHTKNTYFPYERMIQLDLDEGLRALTSLGLFDPTAFTHSGVNYLDYALRHHSENVVRWLISPRSAPPNPSIAGGRTTALPPLYTPQDLLTIDTRMDAVIDDPDAENALATCILSDWRPMFWALWDHISAPAPDGLGPFDASALNVLGPNEQGTLCSWITAAQAERLRATHNLHLGTIPPQGGTGGRAWHVAAAAANTDFMAFLARTVGTDIDDADFRGHSALWVASRARDLGTARALLAHGAGIGVDVIKLVLKDLTIPPDVFLTLFFQRAGVNVARQPWLHGVIQNLSDGIRGLTVRTRKDVNALKSRARRIIEFLYRGNGVAVPDAGFRDNQGRTVDRLAVQLGLADMVYYLQPKAGGRNGRADGAPYRLRRRARVDYRL